MTERRHLAIDAVGAKYGGAAVVVLETLAAAAARPDVGRVTLFCSPASDRRYTLPSAEWLDVEERPHEERRMGARIAWLTGGLARAARRRGADALLALNGARGGDLPTTVFAQQPVLLAAEAMQRLHPGDLLRMTAIRAILWDACRHADHIAVQTPWMRSALVAQLGADPERVVVVGTTSRRLLEGDPARLERAPGEALLYVGSDAPHKNVGVLVAAMPQITRARPRARLLMTLPVGHALEYAHAVCLGYLDDDALGAAYAKADMLVFPSLVESAGLPLVEAMSLGVPIVVADRPYAHDMCGDAALYFDPNDPSALAGRVLSLLDDGLLRGALRREGITRAGRFRAERPYDRLVELAVSPSEARTPRRAR